jgi:hypothetical protein
VPWIVVQRVAKDLLGETWRPVNHERHDEETEAYLQLMDLRDRTDGIYRLAQV